jgi:hypothetical protein
VEDDGGLTDGPAGVEEDGHRLVDRVGREEEGPLGGEVLMHVGVAQSREVERDADAHHERAHLAARGEEGQLAAADFFIFSSSGHRRSFLPVPAPLTTRGALEL